VVSFVVGGRAHTVQPLFTLSKLARFCDVSDRTAAQMAADGLVDVVHIGRCVRVTAESVAKLIGVEYVDRDDDPPLLAFNKAQEVTGFSRPFMYDLIRSGELETVKIGSRRMVTTASLRRLMNPAEVAS
jgi:hypothetical protein